MRGIVARIGLRLARAPLLPLLALMLIALASCVTPVSSTALIASRTTYEQVERQWRQSLGDPELDEDLKHAYLELQRQCRALARHARSMTAEERARCEPVEQAFSVRRNQLIAEKEDLARSLYEVNTPGTVANEYVKWPSWRNERKLHELYEQVTRYTRPRQPWELYRRRPEFQKARLTHYRAEWEGLRDALQEVRDGRQPADLRERRRLARRVAFAFLRLKQELKTNQGLEASLVGPLTRAATSDQYDEEVKREADAMAERARAGRRKEVVVFVHGLGDDRHDWARFPRLLSEEDLADPTLDRYFRVYNYRYDTQDNARSLNEFSRELETFLREVRAAEQVDGVTVIAHSMGGVLSLRALLNSARGTPEPADLPLDTPPAVLAARALEAVRKNPAPLIKRFITLATPFHGDELANIVVKSTIPPHRIYRRYAPLPWRVPFFGTRQTSDLRVGGFHLRSIVRLDTEFVLEPAALIPYLDPKLRDALTDADRAALEAARIPLLSLIVCPVSAKPFNRLEDDGLVRAYAANPRHRYEWGPDADVDIGFRGGEVRYVESVHAAVKYVLRRENPVYRNVVAFLRGAPMPQETPERFGLRRFLTLLRAYPSDFPEPVRRRVFFENRDHTAYLDGRSYEIPKLEITWDKAPGIDLGLRTWNPEAGVFSQAGTIDEVGGSRVLTVTLSAEGYLPRTLSIPVHAGEVTYAVQVMLEHREAPTTQR